jgi:hypothetical protein
MATLRKNRTVQYPMVAEFTFSVTDQMPATDGVTRVFNAAGAAQVFNISGLPPLANVIGGEVVVEVASNDAGTSTIAVGDSALATRYLGATSIKTAGRTALVPTGYRGNGEDIYITLANATGGATAGTVTVRVMYTVQNRTSENQIS